MSGKEHAERILSSRKEESDNRQWEIRKGEILKSGIPEFFSLVCDCLKRQIQDFNSTMNVTEDWGLQFFGCDSYLTITKKSSPIFILKAAIIPDERVKITTQVFGSRTSSEPTQRHYLFDVSKDDQEPIVLNGNGFYQFSMDLLSESVSRFSK
jgi:hypothetical protein